MLNSMFRSTLRSANCCCINLSPAHELYFLNLQSFSSLITTKSGKSKSKDSDQYSFDSNHLVQTFGLSRDKALEISKESKFNIPEKSEALVAFFRQHGFTDAQISTIVKKIPQVFKMNLQTNVLPKIEFFHSLGMSTVETAKIMTTASCVLKRSLENKIIPSYDFLKNLLLSNESTLFAVKRYPAILHVDFQKVVSANFERLQKAGASNDMILHLFKLQPRVFVIQPDKFNVYLEKIEEMGFNPQTAHFLSALYVMRTAGVNWSRKVEVYKKWGISETQVLAAFRRSRCCMASSVDKIEQILEYFSSEMGFDRLILMSSPQIMSLSLQGTIIPRCSVYQVLISKGLIRKNTSLASFLKLSKKSFLEKFVLRFTEESPEISKLYLQKLHLSK